ncbi:MAG: sigma-70 family RNA polymerase sigma factor, partial [Planctomycetota bacterium]|nr:sigma-70 family RNA polymerase sigma factor [Planctomycetota bacterium]
MQEGEVISGLRRGDRTAWTTLYDTYSVRIWRYVAKLVGPNVAAVADIVQETMLAAAQSAQSFDDAKGTLWQWLAGIAHNRVSKYWRAEKQANRLKQLLEANAWDGPP